MRDKNAGFPQSTGINLLNPNAWTHNEKKLLKRLYKEQF